MSDPLQDRIAAGYGIAARRLGVEMDVYRPRDAGPALAARNRAIRLPVLLREPDGAADAPWQAMADNAYTRVGDYLVQQDRCWFVIRQPRLAPLICMAANRVVSLSRAIAARQIGEDGYAGLRRDALRPLLNLWPAAMVPAAAQRAPAAHLPMDHPPAPWTVLLPAPPGITIAAGDRLTDDLGRTGIVSSADLTAEGWRLAVREATS